MIFQQKRHLLVRNGKEVLYAYTTISRLEVV